MRDYAFEVLAWDDLISIISPVNARSQAVAKRLGETYREDIQVIDMTVQIYGPSRTDWERLDR